MLISKVEKVLMTRSGFQVESYGLARGCRDARNAVVDQPSNGVIRSIDCMMASEKYTRSAVS